MSPYNHRPFGWRSAKLREARQKYPHRLVRNHQIDPKPTEIDVAVYGHFAKFPAPDGDEWMFLTRDALERFRATYGGTILGE